MGEALTPQAQEFDHTERLTRGSYRIEQAAGHAPLMTMTPPLYKVTNKFSGHQLTGTVREDDPLNWPKAIIVLDGIVPMHPADKAITPLFRDTRGVQRRKDGTFPAGGKPLPYKFVLSTLRELIRVNTRHFGTRTPGTFGLHSFRIGGMNDLVDSGASFFVVSALGRWTSQSVMDYHRMTRESEDQWQRRAIQYALTQARNHHAAIMQDAGPPEQETPPKRPRLADKPRVMQAPKAGTIQGTLESWLQRGAGTPRTTGPA